MEIWNGIVANDIFHPQRKADGVHNSKVDKNVD
jgi:hypothetical protein